MENEQPITRKNAGSISVAVVLPYLLTALCCLAIIQKSPSDIPPVVVLSKTIGLALAAVALLHAALFVAIRKTPARELILLTLVSFIGLYGGIGNLLSHSIGWPVFNAIWIAMHVGLVGMAVVTGEKKTASFATALAIGLSLAISLQVYGIGMLIAGDNSQVAPLMSKLIAELPQQQTEVAVETQQRPDIYYIIVDAYASQDILEQVYGFDNQPFIDSLRERGFFVGDESRSNYHLTELSLASSLNMTHLHELGLKKFKTRIPIRNMIADSSVVQFLKREGYQTIAFETGKLDTECKQFDRYLPIGNAFNDYQDVLFHSTLLPSLLELSGLPVRSPGRRHGDRTIKTLETIPTAVTADAKPSFVFSHLLAPHPPFVNGANGEKVDKHGYYLLADAGNFSERYNYDLEVYRNAYRNQVAFINQKLVEMIDRIQSSDRRSIIIIQGDHGPRLGFGANPADVATQEEINLRHREAFSILNAIHLPEDLQPTFYSSMTPVNTFRLIFNEMFDANFGLVADESFCEEDYAFENVTEMTMPHLPESVTNPTATKNMPPVVAQHN